MHWRALILRDMRRACVIANPLSSWIWRSRVILRRAVKIEWWKYNQKSIFRAVNLAVLNFIRFWYSWVGLQIANCILGAISKTPINYFIWWVLTIIGICWALLEQISYESSCKTSKSIRTIGRYSESHHSLKKSKFCLALVTIRYRYVLLNKNFSCIRRLARSLTMANRTKLAYRKCYCRNFKNVYEQFICFE